MQNRFIGNSYVSQFAISAASADVMDSTKQAITDHFLAKFKISDPNKANFTVNNSADTLSTIQNVT